ncbi:hypothetical protein CXT76_00980, partial [Candidatus Parvarchaeota archaeon]
HLDSNKEFISDIYEEVKEKDDLWSETIGEGEYVRITFEKKLTSSNDITIFPKIVSGNPRIEVYEMEEDYLITEFTNLIENEFNKVYLEGLLGEQDSFDLKILGGSLEFDLIIDPVTVDDTEDSFTGSLICMMKTGVPMYSAVDLILQDHFLLIIQFQAELLLLIGNIKFSL